MRRRESVGGRSMLGSVAEFARIRRYGWELPRSRTREQCHGWPLLYPRRKSLLLPLLRRGTSFSFRILNHSCITGILFEKSTSTLHIEILRFSPVTLRSSSNPFYKYARRKKERKKEKKPTYRIYLCYRIVSPNFSIAHLATSKSKKPLLAWRGTVQRIKYIWRNFLQLDGNLIFVATVFL